MLNTQENVKSLNQRALGIATTAIPTPLALSIASVVEHAVRQSGSGHVLASSEEWTKLVEEEGRRAFLIHAAKDVSYFVQTSGQVIEDADDTAGVVGLNGIDGVQHLRNEFGSGSFDCHRDHDEPLLVFGSSEGGDIGQVVRVSEVSGLGGDAVIPEANGCVGCTWRQLKVG